MLAFLNTTKKEWIMRLSFGVCFLLLGVMFTSFACKSSPCVDDKVRTAITFLHEGTKDYVENAAQPAIKDKIVNIKTQYDQEKDNARKEELNKQMTNLIEYYNTGKVIPVTTKELYLWATSAPVEKKVTVTNESK